MLMIDTVMEILLNIIVPMTKPPKIITTYLKWWNVSLRLLTRISSLESSAGTAKFSLAEFLSRKPNSVFILKKYLVVDKQQQWNNFQLLNNNLSLSARGNFCVASYIQ